MQIFWIEMNWIISVISYKFATKKLNGADNKKNPMNVNVKCLLAAHSFCRVKWFPYAFQNKLIDVNKMKNKSYKLKLSF